MFGVCVNVKVIVLEWSAVQLCSEMALGKRRAKDSCHNLLPALTMNRDYGRPGLNQSSLL